MASFVKAVRFGSALFPEVRVELSGVGSGLLGQAQGGAETSPGIGGTVAKVAQPYAIIETDIGDLPYAPYGQPASPWLLYVAGALVIWKLFG